MQVQVQVQATGPDDARALYAWLTEEPQIREDGQLTLVHEPIDGEMGVGFDLIQLVVGSGLSATQLIVAISQWRESRRVPAVVLIKIQDKIITLDSSDPARIQQIADELESH